MENVDKEAIAEKIAKLLRLSKSPNPNEANAALAKAQELMMRYNITASEHDDRKEYDRKDYTTERRAYDFRIDSKYIADILSTFFFVDVISITYAQQYMIVGKKENVAIAQFLWGRIRQKFDECWQEYKRQMGKRGIEGKKDYYYGLWVGLKMALEADRARLKKEEGLIVVDDKGLIRYKNETIGETKQSSRDLNLSDRSAINDGVEDGRNIRLNDRLTAGTESNFKKTLNLN
jgi:hypothetical protein